MAVCTYCLAPDGKPCTDRRGRPPLNHRGYEPEGRAVKDHYPHRKVPFNPKGGQ